MLTRQHRLGNSREFRAAFTGGRTCTHRLLILKVLPTASEKPSRFAFSTSSKLGNAVARNRAKRVLREAVRLLGERVIQQGYDAVLIARPPLRNVHISEVIRVLGGLFGEAGVLEGSAKSMDSSQRAPR